MRSGIRNALLAGTAFLAGAGTLAGGYYAVNQRNNPPSVVQSPARATEYVGGIRTPTPAYRPITYLDEDFSNGLSPEWRSQGGGGYDDWKAIDGKLYGNPSYKWTEIQIGDPSWYNYTAEIVFSGTEFPSVTVSINDTGSTYTADSIALIKNYDANGILHRGIYIAQATNQSAPVDTSGPVNILEELDYELPPEQEGPFVLKIRRAGSEMDAKIYGIIPPRNSPAITRGSLRSNLNPIPPAVFN